MMKGRKVTESGKGTWLHKWRYGESNGNKCGWRREGQKGTYACSLGISGQVCKSGNASSQFISVYL